MSEWKNYGDVNFEEHGGTLLSEDKDGKGVNFIWLGESDGKLYASSGYLFKDDIESRATEDELVRDMIQQCGYDGSSILDKAYAYINTYGAIQVGGGTFYDYNPYPATIADLEVSPEQLHEALKRYGVDCLDSIKDEPLFETKANGLYTTLDRNNRFAVQCVIEPSEETVKKYSDLFVKDMKFVFYGIARTEFEKSVYANEDNPFSPNSNVECISHVFPESSYEKLSANPKIWEAMYSAIIAKFGRDNIENLLCIDSRIHFIENRLETPNENVHIEEFCDYENDNKPIHINVSKDKEIPNLYNIKVTADVQGEETIGYINDIEGKTALDGVLCNIANSDPMQSVRLKVYEKVDKDNTTSKIISLEELVEKAEKKFEKSMDNLVKDF